MSGPFAQITQAPPVPSGQNTNQQALIFDRKSNVVESVGDAGIAAALQTALFIQTAQTALTTITAAQNFFNKTLAAGVLNKLNRTITINGAFIYTTPGTTAPVMTIALVLGGVTLCSITAAALSTTASSNMPVQFSFTFNVVSTGSSGTIESHGFVNANISANTPAAAANTYNDTNTAVSSAVNLTSALALQIQISSTLAITSAQLRQLSIEITN